MNVRIVTDSTSDLPVEAIARYNIVVLPAYINIGGQSYLDGVDLSRQEFYERLPSLTEPPTTAAPGIGMFLEAYQKLIAQGATAIISIHLSSTLSNLLSVAQLAAAEITDVPVVVVDSLQLTLGAGLLVLEAARAVERGQSVDEIVRMLEEKRERTYVVAALETLEYLRRSGRVTRWQSSIATLLNVRPVITVHKGELQIERTRTRASSLERALSIVTNLGALERLAMIHTHVPERAEELRQQVQQLCSTCRVELLAEVTPIIGAHVGPGAVGFAIISEKK